MAHAEAREDGAACRPLPFDEALQPKPVYDALSGTLEQDVPRSPLWRTSRGR